MIDNNLESRVTVVDQACSRTISFAIVMVIYNHIPDVDSLLVGSKYAKKILLVDNNSLPIITDSLIKIVNTIGNKCSLIRYSVNKGISGAYNDVISKLKDDVDYFFMFDHDATFNSELFERTIVAVNRYEKQKVGVIVPIVADDRNLMGTNLGIKEEYSIVNSTITSGIFINRNLFLKLGGFNTTLFVEAADYDLTRRISEAGYLLIRINLVLIIQEFEVPVKTSHLISKIVNSIMIKYRSLIRIKINNCNIYRTQLSSYNKNREAELFRNLMNLRKSSLFNGFLLSAVIFFDHMELVLVKIIKKLEKQSQ